MKIKPRLAQALAVVIFAALVIGGYTVGPGSSDGASSDLHAAFEQQLTDYPVQGSASVVRVLPDDNEGSRHQRFIVRLASGQTVLIAHNIDLAPRVDALREGDLIEFAGVYEWNDKGGVVHWTHHDPRGQREGGWLRHEGRDYR